MRANKIFFYFFRIKVWNDANESRLDISIDEIRFLSEQKNPRTNNIPEAIIYIGSQRRNLAGF